MLAAVRDRRCRRGWGGPVTHVAVVAGFLVLAGYPLSEWAPLRLLRWRAAAAVETDAGLS
jgi:hypothetical protein